MQSPRAVQTDMRLAMRGCGTGERPPEVEEHNARADQHQHRPLEDQRQQDDENEEVDDEGRPVRSENITAPRPKHAITNAAMR